MLTIKPELRISIHGIRQHAWMRAPASDPALRPGSHGSLGTLDPNALDAEVMRRLCDMGLDPANVERALSTPLYNHDYACYQMVRGAVLREHDGRASTLSQDLKAARARAASGPPC